jgi:hypothetical protein
MNIKKIATTSLSICVFVAILAVIKIYVLPSLYLFVMPSLKTTTPDFVDARESFTETALRFKQEDVSVFCRKKTGLYTVNGDLYDVQNDNYTLTAPLGASKTTFDEALAADRITKEQFEYYKDFLDKNTFVSCIDQQLNLKASKNNISAYAVRFEINSLQGYLYISDDSIDENTNIKYRDETYKKLEKTAGENWYVYTYREQYGD